MATCMINDTIINPGDRIISGRGDEYIFISCYLKPAPSTGRVVVQHAEKGYRAEYYPGVFDAKLFD